MSDILIDRSRDQIAVVTIPAAGKNACDMAAWTDMLNAFVNLAQDPCAARRLTGGRQRFCAGDDIIAFRAIKDDPVAADAQRRRIQECYAALQDAPFPVVAAIRGVCVGGGCSLAMCCDSRRGLDGRVGVHVAKLGLVIRRYNWSGSRPDRRAAGAALDLYRRNRRPGEAHRAGFLDALIDGAVIEAAIAYGTPMLNAAHCPSRARSAIERDRRGAGGGPGAELNARKGARTHSEDFDEAARAFAEKRPPRFRGR